MPKPHEDWRVLPHGELTQIDDGILTVVGRIHMPLMDLPRRMTVVRLRDSRLVIWSAIALDDTQMHRLEAFGRPAFMILPNDHHRLDAKAWKRRYPELLRWRPRVRGRRSRRWSRSIRRHPISATPTCSS